jgi:hypothetical protein
MIVGLVQNNMDGLSIILAVSKRMLFSWLKTVVARRTMTGGGCRLGRQPAVVIRPDYGHGLGLNDGWCLHQWM